MRTATAGRPPLRVCSITNAFIKVEGNTITGQFAAVFQTMVDLMSSRFNVSLQGDELMGDLISSGSGERRFTGCLGRLQGNRSDTFLPAVQADFAVGPNLSQGITLMPQRTAILSTYQVIKAQQGLQVMDLGGGMTDGAWSLISGAFVTLFLLVIVFLRSRILCLSSKARKRRSFSYRHPINCAARCLVASLAKQASAVIETAGRSSGRILLASLFVTSATVILLLSCLIRAESVVTRRPQVLSTYADLLQRDRKTYWNREMSLHWEFEGARDRSSPAARIWRAAGYRCPGTHCRFSAAGSDLTKVVEEIESGAAVIMIASWAVQAALGNMCSYLAIQRPGRSVWIRCDPSSLERLIVMMKAAALPDPSSKSFDALFTNLLERQVMQGVERQTPPVMQAGKLDSQAAVQLADCKENAFADLPVQAFPLTMHYFVDVSTAAASSLAAAALVLLIELMIARSIRR